MGWKKPNILWQPAPGVQTDFLKCSAFEKSMMGGAGAGKSSCLLAAAAAESANPAMRSLILRLSHPMLKDLIAASYLVYAPMRAQYNVQLHQWKFLSGAVVEFGAIENTEQCIMNFSGRSFSFIGVDEVVQLAADTVDSQGQPINGAYSFLKSRLRAVEGSGLSLTLASTGTPGGVGQGWIRSYFGIKESGESCETNDPITGTRRAYFHCTVADNPALRSTSYAARLRGLPEAQRKALELGDWSSYVGQVFTEWNFARHVCEPFPVPEAWEIWRGADDGFVAPCAVVWCARDPINDRVYVVAELYQRGLRPQMMASEVLRIDKSIPRRCGQRVAENGVALSGSLDSASFADIGSGSRGEQMNRLGCNWTPCEKGAGSRVAGVNEIHARLAPKPDGLAGLIVFSTCRNLIRTLPMLCYSKSHPEDVDTDSEDHLFDSLRYGLGYRRLSAGRTRVM